MQLEDLAKQVSDLNVNFQNMVKKNQNLEHEIGRLKAINEIQNLMGIYEVIHTQRGMMNTWQIFARHTSDTWIEISNWGRVEGFEEIKKFWELHDWEADYKAQKLPQSKMFPPAGVMFDHHLTTPIIEVAGDGKTAKAIWFSPGTETKPRDGKLTAHWCFGKYAIDFVKEDGLWRVWHFKWFRNFITPFNISWVDRPRIYEEAYIGPPGEFKSKKSAFHKPWFTDSIQECIPPAPRPYKTWSEKDNEWHLKPDELQKQ
jgi:hypothetical protein